MLTPRRMLAALPLLLLLMVAACEDVAPTPPEFPPLSYGYLLKLRLNVATVDIDDSAVAPQGATDANDVAVLSPVQPVEVLRRMARDRVIPVGTAGHAVFTIQNASLMRTPTGFSGMMRVRLDITPSEGARTVSAEAAVSRTYDTQDSSEAGARAALYQLVKQLMDAMNVELEYQVKRTLRAYLQPDTEIAPPPPPVEQQDLNSGATAPGADQTASPPPPAPSGTGVARPPHRTPAPLRRRAPLPSDTGAPPPSAPTPLAPPGQPVPLTPAAPPAAPAAPAPPPAD